MNKCASTWQQKWIALDIVAPELQTLATAAENFCGRWFVNSKERTLLVIVGTFGSGKTHTAKAIHRFAMSAATAAFDSKKWGESHFPTAAYISWPEAANAFAEKQFGLMDDANESDLVILDDIGSENDPWKACADKLCQILSRREKKFTVVTTNVPPINWTERFDGRINDRLCRNSVICDISKVGSYALKK